MRIENDIKLDFKDVLFRPKRSVLDSRSQVKLERTYAFMHSGKRWTGIPMIASNMDHTGTFAMAKALGRHQLLTAIDKFQSVKAWQAFTDRNPELLKSTFVSSGTSDDDFEQLKRITKATPTDLLCLDVANGYSEAFTRFVRGARKQFPEHVIMAGNVVTGEMTEELLLSGADIVKIGIGPGSVCTTRLKTGVGYPQLSAVVECADAAHGLGGLVCSDGGCTNPGEVAKAFGAGADFVMIGGMFAGHDECSGEIFTKNKAQFKRFYGMSSAEAMVKHRGQVADYRASEGKSVDIPYRGAVETTVLDILGGLRSTCTYVGASTLKALPKCTTFIRVTQQVNPVFNAYHIQPTP